MVLRFKINWCENGNYTAILSEVDFFFIFDFDPIKSYRLLASVQKEDWARICGRFHSFTFVFGRAVVLSGKK